MIVRFSDLYALHYHPLFSCGLSNDLLNYSCIQIRGGLSACPYSFPPL